MIFIKEVSYKKKNNKRESSPLEMSLALSVQFDNFRALGNVQKSSGDLHLSSKGTNIERGTLSCEKVKIALMHSIHTQTAKTVSKLCKVICMIVYPRVIPLSMKN